MPFPASTLTAINEVFPAMQTSNDLPLDLAELYLALLEFVVLLIVDPLFLPLAQRSCFYQRQEILQLDLFLLRVEYTGYESRLLYHSHLCLIQLPAWRPEYGFASFPSLPDSFCTFVFRQQLLRQTFHHRQSLPSASPHKVQEHYFRLCRDLCLQKTLEGVLPAQNLLHFVQHISQAHKTSSQLLCLLS